ncbi:MAG: hypothetical protein K0R12_3 [Gammaproteobacteria bacterium]|nr:hypothetical protein [Gammaproteobacteria bacterium]
MITRNPANNAFYRITGISLLEAVFTLMIIAAMILATVAYFRQAEHQTQITALLSEVRGVIEAAEEYSNATGSFNGISVDDIAKAHTIVPRYNVVIKAWGGYLIDPWTGLEPSGSDTAGIQVSAVEGGSRLSIKIDKLPSFACEQVLDQLTQFMDIGGTGSLDNKTFCIHLNTADPYTTLGEGVTFIYPKKN